MLHGSAACPYSLLISNAETHIRIFSMKIREPARMITGIFIVVGLCLGSYLLYDRGRPAPISMKQKLYEGVTYRRVVRYLPRPLIAHLLIVDTKSKGIEFIVT